MSKLESSPPVAVSRDSGDAPEVFFWAVIGSLRVGLGPDIEWPADYQGTQSRAEESAERHRSNESDLDKSYRVEPLYLGSTLTRLREEREALKAGLDEMSRAHLASFEALVKISLLGLNDGEVDDYDELADRVIAALATSDPRSA